MALRTSYYFNTSITGSYSPKWKFFPFQKTDYPHLEFLESMKMFSEYIPVLFFLRSKYQFGYSPWTTVAAFEVGFICAFCFQIDFRTDMEVPATIQYCWKSFLSESSFYFIGRSTAQERCNTSNVLVTEARKYIKSSSMLFMVPPLQIIE